MVSFLDLMETLCHIKSIGRATRISCANTTDDLIGQRRMVKHSRIYDTLIQSLTTFWMCANKSIPKACFWMHICNDILCSHNLNQVNFWPGSDPPFLHFMLLDFDHTATVSPPPLTLSIIKLHCGSTGMIYDLEVLIYWQSDEIN